MMNFVVIALIAFSAGFSGSKAEKEDIRHTLKEYFNIGTKDYEDECDVDMKTRLANAKKANKILRIATDNILKEGADLYEPTDERFGTFVSDKCEDSPDVQKAKLGMIQAAIPCASQKRIAKAMKYSLTHTC